jgi:hypothetical protein
MMNKKVLLFALLALIWAATACGGGGRASKSIDATRPLEEVDVEKMAAADNMALKRTVEYHTFDDINSATSLFTTLNFKVMHNHVNYTYTKAEVRYANYETNWDSPPTCHFIEGTEPVDKTFIVAEAEGKNPILHFKDVPDEYLTNILSITYTHHGLVGLTSYTFPSITESDVAISNKNAKLAIMRGISIASDDAFLNYDVVDMDITFNDIAQGNGTLVYSNADCNIINEHVSLLHAQWDKQMDVKIDIRLKKGWNKVFVIYNGDSQSRAKVITLETDDVTFSGKAG